MRSVWFLGMVLGLSACLPKLPPQPSDAALTPPELWLQAAAANHEGLGVSLAEPQTWWAQLGDAQLNNISLRLCAITAMSTSPPPAYRPLWRKKR